jgi:hypothetical protein
LEYRDPAFDDATGQADEEGSWIDVSVAPRDGMVEATSETTLEVRARQAFA